MMGGIGVTVGLIGFLLYTFIGIFGAVKYHTVRSVPFSHQQERLLLAVSDGWLKPTLFTAAQVSRSRLLPALQVADQQRCPACSWPHQGANSNMSHKHCRDSLVSAVQGAGQLHQPIFLAWLCRP